MNEMRERENGKMNSRRGTYTKLGASPATARPIKGHREATACHVGFCGYPLESYDEFTIEMIEGVS